MELAGLICNQDFAQDCEIEIYEFENYKVNGDKYSGTARFEVNLISENDSDLIEKEYRLGQKACSTSIKCLTFLFILFF